ncbi:MAG: FISUMP domain-containing protein, partial [Ignavibacteriaceae bacterium]
MKKVIYFILVSLLAFTSCKKASNPTSPNDDISTVTYSGKVYHAVKIGSQTWLKENLDVGTMIQGTANPSDNGTIEKYCYNNDTANCNKYGGLYQWNEAMQYIKTEKAKGICPTGWHIPTKA